MSWKQNNGRDRGHIDGIGYFLKGPNDSIIKAIEPSGNYVSAITNEAGVTKVFLNIAYPTQANQTLSSDLSGNLEWNSFVPYSGADKKVNLGPYDLTVQNMTIGLGGGVKSSNTAIGYQALYSNTDGSYNTANGYQALFRNTTGFSNTANGYQCLYRNTTGTSNTANGYKALFDNTTGSYNTATGVVALNKNKSGINNTANGYNALFNNIDGNDNTATGVDALESNTSGSYNTATGVVALNNNKSGINNTANGYKALFNNIDGTDNTANGSEALYSNTTGGQNTATGSYALNRTTGVSNTAIGCQALINNTSGNSNTAIGRQAGASCATNSNCTFIGEGATDPSGNDNTIILGNSAIQHLKCQVTTISGLSDDRDKKEIEPLSYGLNYINEINPVHFLWNMRNGGKIDIPEIGFTAQNLKKAETTLNINIPNLVNDNNPDRLEVAPAVLIPILVKSIQELSSKLNETNRKLEELTAKVNSI